MVSGSVSVREPGVGSEAPREARDMEENGWGGHFYTEAMNGGGCLLLFQGCSSSIQAE